MSRKIEKQLARCHNIDDLRREAARRLPFPVFDFVDGGAEDEAALRRNRSGFDRYTLVPRTFVDVSKIDLSTTVLGTRLDMPLVIAPMGLPRVVHHTGELSLVQAAERYGVAYALSSAASYAIEDVAKAAKGPKWFQIYIWKDRDLLRDFITRCRDSGYTALCLTVDVPVVGNRERDLRNGLSIPPKLGLAALVDMLRKPAWLWHFRTKPPITLANLVGRIDGDTSMGSLSRYTEEQFDKTVSWDDMAWIMEQWGGPFAIKGILRPEDARRAAELGCDGIVVSNHGGRQLDHAPAPIDILPEIVAAVEGKAEVILDGGVRRGTDILKVLALGARACMIGRPFLYGLAAGAKAGVERAFEIFASELRRDMMLAGCPDITSLGSDLVRLHD
jgi:L-lactate dehydrogenase (cytochrome)